jgi:autotransporter-associated beta strand protein
MKKLTPNSLRFIPVALCLLFALLANNAKGANEYFHVNGTATAYGITANSSYDWDAASPNYWTTTATAAPTTTWPAGGFARFNSTITPYTLTVNGTVSMAGLYAHISGVSITINATGAGTLSVVPNATVPPDPLAQGFYITGNVIINAPISGTGGIQPQYVAGSPVLSLYGINTYSGGTLFTSSSTLINFNNNSSFGIGTNYINMASGSYVALLGKGGATITLANGFTNCISGGGVNFAADANTPVISSGNWTLAANNLNLRNNGVSTSPLTLSGVISGAANLTLSANNSGTIIFSGPNTYSGQTIIAGGNSGVTLSVASLNSVNGGTPLLASSSLGAPTTVANGTISIGAGANTCTLVYTGSGETSDRVINLAGSTGGAIIENDGSGPITFGSVTATVAGAKTLTLRGSNTGANTIAGAIVNGSGTTSLVKAQAGTWVLAGANTYTGGTTISGGTLKISSGSVVGNVTNNAGVLELDSATALSASAVVSLAGSLPNGSVMLNFSGSQTVNALYIGGVAQPTGTYGASGSDHDNLIFSGSGLLNVLGAPVVVTQPQSATVWPDASVTFTVVALGSPTYQWKRNDGDVTGGNASSLTINPVEVANAGTYVCWLTNAFGWTNTANAVLTVLATNAYTQIVRADTPISYWRLDETSGTVARDSVGPNNGTYNNVLLNQTPGYSTVDSDACIGLWAAPSGSYVSVANYNAFNFFTSTSPQFTLEGWAYFTNTAGVQRMFSTDQNVAPNGYMFGISGASQLVFTTSTGNDYLQSLASPLQVNVWYHLAVTSDGSSFHFYVNGQEQGTGLYYTGNWRGTNGVPMCLGANGNFAGIYEQLLGRLDECAIYGSTLSQGQLLAHYQATLPSVPVTQTPVADQPTNYVSLTTTFTANAVGQDLHYQWSKVGSGPVGSDSSTLTLSSLALGDAGSYQVVVSNGGGSTNPPAATLTVLAIPTSASQVGLTNSLVLHLPFDTDYNDISGRNNNGTAVNATTLPTDTPVVGGGYLHYSSDVTVPSYNYVTLGKPSDLQFGSSVDFSAAFWVRQAYANVGTNLPFFGSAAGSIGANLGFCFAPGLTDLASPNGGWAWSLYDGAHQDYATGLPSSISDGNWHHLAFVFSRAANVTTYLDGQQVDSRSDSYLAASIDSGNTINIGQDATGTYPAAATQADLDDLGVWRRALTQLEVSGMYLAGKDNIPGVSFAPVVVLAPPPAPTTISNIIGTTLTYGGGAGSQFVLLGTNDITAPLTNWTRLATNSSTPGSFTIPAVGSASPTFYRIQSE